MTELAYAERATNFNTTNTDVFSTASASLIGGALTVTLVGTGDPVNVEFYAPTVVNSVGALATSWFVVNGNVTHALGQYRKWSSTAQGEGGTMVRRMVLTNGVEYTIRVGMAGGFVPQFPIGQVSGITTVLGQITVGGKSAGTMHLRVTD